MSEQGSDRASLEAQIMERAANDQSFRQELTQNPRQALNKELGVDIPDSVSIKVLQETPNEFFVILPPPAATSSRPLSSQDLSNVAGGWSGSCGGTCDHTCASECVVNTCGQATCMC